MSIEVLNDKYWVNAAEFVARLGSVTQSVIAPREFLSLLQGVISYDRKEESPSPDVLVLHKAMLEQLGNDWIERTIETLHPAFANDVFVIFTKAMPAEIITNSVHFTSFKETLKALADVQKAKPALAPGRVAIYLGDNRALTKTIYGHKIYVHTRDVALTPHILLDGYWEQWVTNVFRRIVRPGMSVVDIGANIGYYSLLAADLIGPSGNLVAFEANPEIADLLHCNLSLNGFLDRAKVESKAVYSSTQVLRFGIYERYLGSSSIFATNEAAAMYRDKIRTVEVEAVSLDEYFSPNQRVDVIKIDAEGAEPAILTGATRVLADNRNVQIIMEYAPSLFQPSYGSSGKFYNHIRELGLRIFRIQHDGSLQEQSLDDLAQVDGHCEVLLRIW